MALAPRYFNVDRECVLGRSVNNLDHQIVWERGDQLEEEQTPKRKVDILRLALSLFVFLLEPRMTFIWAPRNLLFFSL